jgi:hypothetical protein
MSIGNLPGGKGRPERKAYNPSSVSRLSRQFESLDVSQPYRPPWSVTELALPLQSASICCFWVGPIVRDIPWHIQDESEEIASLVQEPGFMKAKHTNQEIPHCKQ